MTASERWRPVLGYEESYLVSDLGNVKSLDRATITKTGRTHRTKGMPLSPAMSGGYWVVTLCQRGETSSRSIHSLVAEAFISPRPGVAYVNHIDGVKTNNVPANLEYVSSAENTRHAAAIGLRPSGDAHWTRATPWKVKRGAESWSANHADRFARGEMASNAKLTEADVRGIRAYRSAGHSFASIASRFGVSPMTIFQIAHWKTWRHIK